MIIDGKILFISNKFSIINSYIKKIKIRNLSITDRFLYDNISYNSRCCLNIIYKGFKGIKSVIHI